jgi:hypothetical protein
MADPNGIPPPLTERTLVHGRNVMAIAGIMMVLAWVPGIEVREFHPLGFTFDDGSMLSAWCLLVGVLAYYVARFFNDWTIDLYAWAGTYLEPLIIRGDGTETHIMYLYRRAKRFDIGIPILMAVGGMFAGGYKIYFLLFG